MSMTLGPIAVLAVRLLIPWTGAWVADCDLDLGSDKALPTGKQSLTVGATTLVGTVDSRATGKFGEKARARIVGGGGGWANVVTAIHLHNDAGAGVTSTQALGAVASQIGETVVDASPVAYGPDWELVSGPAVGALEGRQWYVDGNGITQVAAWPSLSLGKDADVLSYDVETRRAELAADEVVWPGTTITDLRFGAITVRDVDQRFTASGSQVTVWHSTVAAGRFNPLLSAIASIGGQQWLKVYRYRIVLEGSDGRLQLQAINKAAGVPDTLPLSVWPGMAGLSAKFTLGQQCAVVFLEGDKTLPRVIHFDGASPQELYLDATTLLRLGAGASSYVALATKVDAIFAALTTLTLAVSAYAGGIKAIADPSNGSTPALTSAVVAFNAAVQSVAALKVKAQ